MDLGFVKIKCHTKYYFFSLFSTDNEASLKSMRALSLQQNSSCKIQRLM